MAAPTKPQGVTPRNDLTAGFVRSILDYNPKTGDLIWRYRTDISPKWRERWNKRYAGTVAGDKSSEQHISVGIGKYSYVAHRLIWLLVTGQWPTQYVDHRDGNPHNNCWKNLRQALPHQNIANQKVRRDNTSGLKGASLHKPTQKWIAQIAFKGQHIYLGLFKTKEEAHAAYCAASKKLHGEFSRTK